MFGFKKVLHLYASYYLFAVTMSVEDQSRLATSRIPTGKAQILDAVRSGETRSRLFKQEAESKVRFTAPETQGNGKDLTYR